MAKMPVMPDAQLYQQLGGNPPAIETKSSKYRDVILNKVKQKYTEAIPGFAKRIYERFAFETLVEGQCRLCGLKNKSCCKIFETNSTLCKLVNTYMPITVTEKDVLPLNVCLECLGILQNIDDLAYRCYLVEACLLQHYKDFKDTSIFLDKKPEGYEKPYKPLHLQLPKAKETPHPASSIGFPARRKGSFIQARYFNEHDKLQAALNKNIFLKSPSNVAGSLSQGSTSTETVEDDSPETEVVKNNLKANLQKILLGGAASRKQMPSILRRKQPNNQSQSLDPSHDHDYSFRTSPVKDNQSTSPLGIAATPVNTGCPPCDTMEAVKSIATAALAQLDKKPAQNSTLLNLSEILNSQSQELDEPVYIILVNDKEKESTPAKAPVAKAKPRIINLQVDPHDPPSTSEPMDIETFHDETAHSPEDFADHSNADDQGGHDSDCQIIDESQVQKDNSSATADKSSKSELSLATEVEGGVNPDDEMVKFSESLQTEQIKRWFTIQILKTPNENDDGNMNEGNDEGVMLVTYVVYYSKINGKLVPHHFSLMNDSFSDVTRRRAYSIISTMLKEEKNRVLAFLETTQKKATATAALKPASKVQPKKPFRTTCCYCNKTMKESDLTSHTLANHMVRCKYCRVFFSSKDELMIHECEVHEKKSAQCDSCQKKYYDEEDKFFCLHSFSCSVCKKQFTDWNEFLHHERIHANSTALKFMRDFKLDFGRTATHKGLDNEKVFNFMCSSCGKKFETQVESEQCDHMYDCKICRNQFSNYPLFVTHGCISNPDLLRIVGKKKNHKKILCQCALCLEQFDGQKTYFAHYYACMLKHGIQVDLTEEIKSLQTNSPVKCIFCDESFKSIFIFELHYNQCFKMNSTECEECDEVIPIKKQGAHMLFCDTRCLCDFCGTTFPTKKLYRQHLRQQLDGSTVCMSTADSQDFSFSGYISEGFDPNNCHICGKIFVNGHTLDRHVKCVHLGLEKSCPLCGLKFKKHNSITMFLKHRLTHSEEELKEVSSGESFGSVKCGSCEKWFSSKLLKLLHEIYYHDKVLHKCNACETEFVALINLKSHETKCKPFRRNLSVYTCEHCQAVFPKINLYYQHLETHDITYSCDECGKTFKKKTNLNKHKEVAHTNSPSICDVCGREFSCEKYCKIHKRNLHGDQNFLCQVCGKTFHNKKRLSLHASVHSGLKPYKCRYCEKYFRTHTIRNVHEDKHKNEFRYECNFCQHKFSRFINLYVHKRKVHADKCTYQCMKCGCGYNDLEFYTNHIKNCGGRRKRLPGNPRTTWCAYCDKTFGSVKFLKAHYTPATDAGTIGCSNISCGKRFDSLCSAKMHERVHAVDKFPCKLCGEAFLGMKQLELHSQLKHNETFTYHCSYCGRGYMFEKFLKKHIKYCNESLQQLAYTVNKSKKPIVRCDSCGKIFAKFKDLRVHMTLAHGSETYKDYQCLICDSKYDSYIQLSKHSKHHFKDATNPGSYCCPKCKIHSSDWEVMMNHVCGNGLPKRGDTSRFSNVETKIQDSEPHTFTSRRKSPRKPVPKYDSDDDYATPSRGVNSRYHGASSSDYHEGPSYSRAGGKSKPSGRSMSQKTVVIQEEEFMSDEEMPEHPITNDDTNLIYHCSFCSSNFDHILTLQKHLTADHNLSLNSLEFQLVE